MLTAPKPLTNAERQRKYRAESKDKYYKTRRKYRHDNSKWQTDAAYLSREFVAWDGEGITTPDGIHRYVMLAVKATEGDSDYLAHERGLGTAQIFDFILAAAERNKGGIHIIYGGGYDFNMWLRDMNRDDVEATYKNKFHVWHGYRIGWRPGKSFYLCRLDAFGNNAGIGVTIYDVVSFFQCPFVKACDDYLGDRFTNREMIVSNKELRSSFTLDDVEQMRIYNDAELDNLLALMHELRERLNKVGLRPRRWDGPGAVASALLLREKVKDSQAQCPPEVARAARYAYAGGRFEVIKFGHVNRKAYEYDVNSAYPSALRSVPNLAEGRWNHIDGDAPQLPFAIYHVEFTGNRSDIPAPLFRRDPNGTICYPMAVTGWYWSPEMQALRNYCERGYGKYRILECWEFRPTSEVSPFAFIEPLYNKRRALKKAGDGAHVGIKLALNSLYGKLAQQVGWEQTEKGLRIPPFHQLEWAGYTTSHCRAAVLNAALEDIESVIAFETDALFTSRPLSVKLGTNLGDFEYTEFANLTYVQSGMYFGQLADGTEVVSKTRGVDRGQLTREIVVEKLTVPKAAERYAVTELTRFIGAGIALAQNFDNWCRWVRMEKHMVLEPTGKRIHIECAACDGSGITLGEWHETMCPFLTAEHSAEFPIEWINPNPEMTELSIMRGEEVDYE